MFRNAILGAIFAFGAAGAATAAESPLTVLGTGENFAVEYANDGGNILGGGPVTVIGRGQDARYLHAADAPAQPARVANFVGQGENGQIVYTPASATRLNPAG